MKIRDLTKSALFAAIMIVCAWIYIPGPVPFTMQTFGIYLGLYLLGGRITTIGVVVYLLLGIVGLPVFSAFQGGVSVLIGATGGYLTGFLAICLVFWFMERKGKGGILAAIMGTAVCYAVGTVWYVSVYLNGNTPGIAAALVQYVLPYIIPDGLKLFLAHLVSKRMKKSTG